MRIAIVEPYYGGSHRAWADGYRDHSRHAVTLFTHEARFWKWRMQGSYVTLAEAFARRAASDDGFDLILASDMLHLPAFLGSIGPTRGSAAVALYMHENQLTYPLSPRDSPDESYAIINWASMTVADAVFFNSQFHHDVWWAEIPKLLRRFPDYRHESWLAAVAAKSEVLPIGIDLRRVDETATTRPGRRDRPLVLWNQRWDFDKGPDEFATAMLELAATHDFSLALAGEQITELEALTQLTEELGDRLTHVGYAGDSQYLALLQEADIVVSTASQEFFGIAVTEAIYAGAFPVLPAALVYPERVPDEFHSTCLYGPDELVGRLRWALDNAEDRRRVVHRLRPHMAVFDWSRVAPQYDDRLQQLVD